MTHSAPDILERLRQYHKEWGDDPLGRVFVMAADEIEKLRAQVVAQTTDNPITRAVGWWEGPIPAAGRADDAKVMRIWRECELPEYFLGNGGSNHKLVAFVKACAADEIERLRAMWQPAPRGGMTSDWQYWSLVYQRRLRKLKKLIAAQGYDILSDEDGMPTALERKP